MLVLVKATGVLICAAGILIFLFPGIARSMMVFWRQGRRLYWGGLIRILLGVLFLLTASRVRLQSVMVALGIVALWGGGFIFVAGAGRLRGILERMEKKPDSAIRLLSILVLAFGALIIYAA